MGEKSKKIQGTVSTNDEYLWHRVLGPDVERVTIVVKTEYDVLSEAHELDPTNATDANGG